jgi:hypothetical protein
MSDARWGDPREYGDRDPSDERPRVYDERDWDDQDPRDALVHDLDLPLGEQRELVVSRDRVYELNGDDSRTLAAVGTFRVVPEQDLDIEQDIQHESSRLRVQGERYGRYRSCGTRAGTDLCRALSGIARR